MHQKHYATDNRNAFVRKKRQLPGERRNPKTRLKGTCYAVAEQ